MSRFILVLEQGGGCDYTIGCGTKVVELDATDGTMASLEAIEVIDYYGGFAPHETRVAEATIYKVDDAVQLDLDGIRAGRKAEADKAKAKAKEKKERREFERLQKKFGGKP